MTRVQELARWVESRQWSDLGETTVERLRVHLLDSLGCAFGALDGEPIRMLREHLEDFAGRGHCTLIGAGRVAPDRAAFYNSALVRYLDFNDSYLAAGETCHPSDNLGAVLAAVEYADGSGRDLLLALAIAYQVQCRLSDEAPVRRHGFDHTVQGQYAAAAAVARALGLDAERIAHAVAISATAHNALRVTRTGSLSHWKGLAYPETVFTATHSAFLARRGITGPPEVFEGNKGFVQSIAGEFALDWEQERLDRVERAIVKKYNAEVHSQSTLEGVLELRRELALDEGDPLAAVEAIEIDTFDVAYHIIGGGEEGAKTDISTKEEADHSLPYMVSVALLDGDVLPAQYAPERIGADDVQQLLRRVEVREKSEYSDRFPEAMPCDVRLVVGGERHERHKDDYEGFHTRPMSWDGVVAKVERLAGPPVGSDYLRELVATVEHVEEIPVRDLCALLARAGGVG